MSIPPPFVYIMHEKGRAIGYRLAFQFSIWHAQLLKGQCLEFFDPLFFHYSILYSMQAPYSLAEAFLHSLRYSHVQELRTWCHWHWWVKLSWNDFVMSKKLVVIFLQFKEAFLQNFNNVFLTIKTELDPNWLKALKTDFSQRF